jgi:hypothetical protein
VTFSGLGGSNPSPGALIINFNEVKLKPRKIHCGVKEAEQYYDSIRILS